MFFDKSSFSEVLIVLLITLVTLIYFYVRTCYTYWERCGFPYIKPIFPFGTFKNLMLQKVSMIEAFGEIYTNTTERFIGMFIFLTPMLMIRDEKLANRILVTDFQHFVDRGFYCDEEYDPISGTLAGLKGHRWRAIRAKLTPAFTAIKLKAMFSSTILKAGNHLIEFLGRKSESGETFDVGDLSARYTIDSIASIAFGLDINSVKNPDNQFCQIGTEFFKPKISNALRHMLMFLYPQLLRPLRIKWLPKDSEEFFIALVTKIIEEREHNGTEHRDFMQLLLQLRNSNEVNSENEFKCKISKVKSLTIPQLAAHTMAFFFAGFETSSTTMSFCLYELAKNPQIQKQLQDEIDHIVGDSREITYENMTSLEYLDACIYETLRKYTPNGFLKRQCTKSYKIPDSDLTIEEGTHIIIPIAAFHMSEIFYHKPNEFIPERFLNKSNRNNMIYFPFGDGPRMCAAPKIGMMQVKMGVFIILRNFNLKLDHQKMNRTLKFDPKSFICKFKSGIHLRIEKRHF